MSPKDLQALLAGVVKEAGDNARANSEESDKLDRAREGAIESLKLTHNHCQHLGTLSLAALAAFGAMLGGVFSDPQGWDDAFTILPGLVTIPTPRSIVVYFTFAAFLTSAIMANGVQESTRVLLKETARANSITELDALLARNRRISLRHRERLERLGLSYAFGLGIVGLLIFLGQSIPS